MHRYLLCAISCLCVLPAGRRAEECNRVILARREEVNIPEGNNLSLSCVVQHCGETWTGSWIWKNVTDKTFSTIKNSDRRHETNETLSGNKTRLVLTFRTVLRSDEGTYGCKVTWGQGDTDQGHLMFVNVSAAVPSGRNWLHRIAICASAFLCVPIILGLARCLSSGVKHQPLPGSQSTHAVEYKSGPRPPPRPKYSPHSHSGSHRSKQKYEVVYADISEDALRKQTTTREPPTEPTVYSNVKFS